MRLGGAAFLIVCGALRFRVALRGGEALLPTAALAAPLRRVSATCLLLGPDQPASRTVLPAPVRP